MWSLVTKRDMPAGTFLGCYTGAMDRNACPDPSYYALDMGAGAPCILPFPDEQRIKAYERDRHPFASMNEPGLGQFSTVHLEAQDFSHDEIDHVEAIANYETARFFRAICCFTCADVRQGDQLTWFYGASYQRHRDQIGYTAGGPCRTGVVTEPRSILESLGKVPHYAVAAITGRTVKSQRFKIERKRRVDSDGEEESDCSGSEYEEAYKPRASRRRQGVSF